jgi:hypothetical protein
VLYADLVSTDQAPRVVWAGAMFPFAFSLFFPFLFWFFFLRFLKVEIFLNPKF